MKQHKIRCCPDCGCNKISFDTDIEKYICPECGFVFTVIEDSNSKFITRIKVTDTSPRFVNVKDAFETRAWNAFARGLRHTQLQDVPLNQITLLQIQQTVDISSLNNFPGIGKHTYPEIIDTMKQLGYPLS